MPRVRPLTEAGRKAETEQNQRQRVIRIINAAMAAYGYDRQALAKRAGLEYQQFNRRMRGESDFRMPELCSIADALGFDTTCRAALCGSKEKCRWETGYRESA